MFKKHQTALLLSAMFASSMAQSAIITTYTDRDAFISALGGLTIIEEDFNSRPLQTFDAAFSLDLGDFTVSSDDVAGDTIGVTDVVYDNDHWWDEPKPENLGSVDGTRFFGINGSAGGPSFDVSFSTERYVFGFDWLDGDVTDSYAMTVLGEVYESPPFDSGYLIRNSPYRGFFGVISDTAFTDVSFYQTAAGGDIAGFGIDNLITSQIDVVTCVQNPDLPECTEEPANGVPVPAPMALIGLGLAAFGFSRKRKA